MGGRGCPEMLIFVGSQAALLRAAEACQAASLKTRQHCLKEMPISLGRFCLD
jgi:hypothetical protein